MPEDITTIRALARPTAAKPAADDRPAKPYPTFPLFPHRNGQWAKKVRGRFVFFGIWADPMGARDRYLAQKDELHAGLVPRRRPATSTRAPASASGTAAPAATDVPTLRDLANHFLTAKKRQRESGELSLRSFDDLYRTCSMVLEHLGRHRRLDDITTEDFGGLRASLGEGRGPVTLAIHIQRTRSMFKYGFEAGLLERPMRFGTEFKKPAKRSMRQSRQARGPRMYESEEIALLLEAAGVQLRAMILLGLNCGMGNTDVASLPGDALDLDRGLVDFPRPKTAIPRRATLWPETVEALRAVIEIRPQAKLADEDKLVFITKYGHRWLRVKAPGPRAKPGTQAVTVDAIGLEFGKLQRRCGIESGGRGFYALRHTFRTVGDEVNDRPAIDLIMGHQDSSDIATHYIERIGDERLRRVTDYVRQWAQRSVV
ncbi:MAG: tyrosine-type recombinase/integrase [Planctomycetota bacterium]|nr:tyrosine-type recombinase/integrase [Planctomycetota bacterium]